MRILIIDYGMGNLASVYRALEECGGKPFISENPEEVCEADGLILPGVGAFGDGMKQLRERGWADAIKKQVEVEKMPILGICLGMHLLAETGYEGGITAGLGLIPGEVQRLSPIDTTIRIPHVGWNEVYQERECTILKKVPDGSDFYFVHSYNLIPKEQEVIAGKTSYGGDFVAVVENGHIFGTQFHPEKSGNSGFQILRNFLQSY
jgi:glutamine amidotransferase